MGQQWEEEKFSFFTKVLRCDNNILTDWTRSFETNKLQYFEGVCNYDEIKDVLD